MSSWLHIQFFTMNPNLKSDLTNSLTQRRKLRKTEFIKHMNYICIEHIIYYYYTLLLCITILITKSLQDPELLRDCWHYADLPKHAVVAERSTFGPRGPREIPLVAAVGLLCQASTTIYYYILLDTTMYYYILLCPQTELSLRCCVFCCVLL